MPLLAAFYTIPHISSDASVGGTLHLAWFRFAEYALRPSGGIYFLRSNALRAVSSMDYWSRAQRDDLVQRRKSARFLEASGGQMSNVEPLFLLSSAFFEQVQFDPRSPRRNAPEQRARHWNTRSHASYTASPEIYSRFMCFS